MKLLIRIAEERWGHRAWCPALPGCSVMGQTRQEALELIQKAVDGYLASLDVALPRELDRQLDAVNGAALPPAARHQPHVPLTT